MVNEHLSKVPAIGEAHFTVACGAGRAATPDGRHQKNVP